MATSRLDQLTRSASMYLSRRTLAGALGLGALALPIGSEARKKRKKKKKVKRNGFGCVNVGGYCKNGGQCCSGICQGKKGKKKCQAHNTGGCQPGNLLTDCGGQDVNCPNVDGLCATTTGKAAACSIWKFNLPVPCRRDADCDVRGGEKVACVLCGNSTTCAVL